MPERMRGTSREMVQTARELRQRQTEAEARLWQALRNRQVMPVRVRRQHPYGRYVLDFWIPQARIAIELDGGIHDDPAVALQDADRAAWLQSDDILLLRFRNEMVLTQLDAVIESIRHHVSERQAAKKPATNFREM